MMPPSQEDEENRQLTVLRKRISSLRTRTINNVQHILLKHNLQQECPTKKIQQRQSTNQTATIVASMPGAAAYSSLALASRKNGIGFWRSMMRQVLQTNGNPVGAGAMVALTVASPPPGSNPAGARLPAALPRFLAGASGRTQPACCRA